MRLFELLDHHGGGLVRRLGVGGRLWKGQREQLWSGVPVSAEGESVEGRGGAIPQRPDEQAGVADGACDQGSSWMIVRGADLVETAEEVIGL